MRVRSFASGTISAVVTRADGTVENLGVIAKTPWYYRFFRR